MRRLKAHRASVYYHVTLALFISNVLSLILFGLRVLESGSWRYLFMFWNLWLAWLPLLFAWRLVVMLRGQRWFSIKGVALTALWLGFLPNSFYVMSDLIHLHSTGEVSLLYDIVMFASFIFNAYIAGYMSVYLVHQALLVRLGRRAHIVTAVVFAACGYAIYLGRFLRWNTWDVLVNPAGLLFDVSGHFLNPVTYREAYVTTGIFFLLLVSIYTVMWHLVQALRSQQKS